MAVGDAAWVPCCWRQLALLCLPCWWLGVQRDGDGVDTLTPYTYTHGEHRQGKASSHHCSLPENGQRGHFSWELCSREGEMQREDCRNLGSAQGGSKGWRCRWVALVSLAGEMLLLHRGFPFPAH